MLLTANIFQPLIDVFETVLKFFHNDIGVGWGLSIVLLTVAVRLLLVPLAFVAFEFTLNLQGLSFFETQRALWNREPFKIEAWAQQFDWDHLQQYSAAQVNFALDAGLTAFVLLVSAVIALRWRLSYAVYGALCVLLPLSTIQTNSLDRYALAAFTVPLFLARFGEHEWFDRVYTLSATLLLALYTILFVQGYWAG